MKANEFRNNQIKFYNMKVIKVLHTKLRQQLFLSLIFILSLSAFSQETPSELYLRLKKLNGVVEITPLKHNASFQEKYVLKIKQWLDVRDTAAGSFTQRVFVSHVSYDAPTVMITEGYGGDYAENTEYVEELSKMFKTNQIFVEHRFFNESTPTNKDWKYLTTTNAAADHHNIRQLFKDIYQKKWIATGISKGGQTALIYRTLYPEDVDITVCYVAPLCFGVEDGRHEPFIGNQVADNESRKKILDYQNEVLKRRKKMLPLLENYCKENNYSFRISMNEVLDYCVLEFSFSFWQWGWKISSIPSSKASDADLFKYLVRVCSPEYFAIEGIEPTLAFFVQAAKELGYYGYDVKPFKKNISIKTAQGYLNKIFLPENSNFAFDRSIADRCARYLKENDPQMIFIYGEYDPWSAAAVSFEEKQNMYKAVAKGGSHAARISSLPADVKNQVVDRLKKWLE